MRRPMERKERKMGEGNHRESEAMIESPEWIYLKVMGVRKGQNEKAAEETLNNKEHGGVGEPCKGGHTKKGAGLKIEERPHHLSIFYWNF